MSASWSLKDLRDFIVFNRNKDQYLLDVVSSIDRGIFIFRYHFSTARDSLTSFHSSNENVDPIQLRRILGSSTDNEEYQIAKIVNEANTVAAIYTVRSLYDLFSQLVRGLLLEKDLSEEACNIHRVGKILPEGELKSAINEIINGDGFSYINAFANLSKHRSLVKFKSQVDFFEDRSGVKFSAFEYRGKTYQEQWSEEILEKILKTKNEIVTAGIALNAMLFKK